MVKMDLKLGTLGRYVVREHKTERYHEYFEFDGNDYDDIKSDIDSAIAFVTIDPITCYFKLPERDVAFRIYHRKDSAVNLENILLHHDLVTRLNIYNMDKQKRRSAIKLLDEILS